MVSLSVGKKKYIKIKNRKMANGYDQVMTDARLTGSLG
jgi:hypothetical protein